MGKRGSFVTDTKRVKYRLTDADASVSVGISGETEGKGVKARKRGAEGKRVEGEREERRVIRVARWPCGWPARSSFCYDPKIRSHEATCIRDGASRGDDSSPCRSPGSDRRSPLLYDR